MEQLEAEAKRAGVLGGLEMCYFEGELPLCPLLLEIVGKEQLQHRGS